MVRRVLRRGRITLRRSLLAHPCRHSQHDPRRLLQSFRIATEAKVTFPRRMPDATAVSCIMVCRTVIFLGVLRNLSKTGRQNRGKIRPSSTNFESSSSPFRSAKSGVNVGGDFVYQVSSEVCVDNSHLLLQVYEGEESETHTDCHLKDSSAQENSCTAEATVVILD